MRDSKISGIIAIANTLLSKVIPQETSSKEISEKEVTFLCKVTSNKERLCSRVIYNKSINFTRLFALASLAILFLSILPAAFAISEEITLQGKLTNSSGQALSGDYTFIFELFDSNSGGVALWTETHGLTVTNGVFAANLGSNNLTQYLTTSDFNAERWVQITVDGSTQVPRVKLNSHPSAFIAKKAMTIDLNAFMQFSDFNSWYASTFAPTFTGDSNFTNIGISGEPWISNNAAKINYGDGGAIDSLTFSSEAAAADTVNFTGTHGGQLSFVTSAAAVQMGSSSSFQLNANDNITISAGAAKLITMNASQYQIQDIVAGDTIVNIKGTLNVTEDSNFANIGVSGTIFGGSPVKIGGGLQSADANSSNDTSLAFGEGVTAFGTSSFVTGKAAGNERGARGDYSFAAGNNAMAWGDTSMAVGNTTKASGQYSFAQGWNTTASQSGSAAFGTFTTASGQYSVAMGNSSAASGSESFAAGNDVTARGSGAVAFGGGTDAFGDASLAIGSNPVAQGNYSFAGGWSSPNQLKSIGIGSFAFGQSQGGSLMSYGEGSVLMGYSDSNMATQGKGSIALGYNVRSIAEASITLGKDLTNYNANSVLVQDLNVLGDLNVANFTVSGISFINGGINVTGDSNFVNVGISGGLYSISGSNQFIWDDTNGSLAIGRNTTSSGENSTGNMGAIAWGYGYNNGDNAFITASGKGSMAGGYSDGKWDIAYIQSTANGSVAMGNSTSAQLIASGTGAIAMGTVGKSGELFSTGSGSIAMGSTGTAGKIYSTNSGSIALGMAANGSELKSTGQGSITMGYSDSNSFTVGAGAIAMGYNVKSLAEAAVTLGKDLTNYNANSVLVQDLNVLGDANFVNIEISGTLFGGSPLEIGSDLNIAGATKIFGQLGIGYIENAARVLDVNGGVGGPGADYMTDNAGIGGGVKIASGPGGHNGSAGGINYGGAGGPIELITGKGGAVKDAEYSFGGNGGLFSITTGIGGAAFIGDTSFGGNGGDIELLTGAGGESTAGVHIPSDGGDGGDISLTTGSGGIGNNANGSFGNILLAKSGGFVGIGLGISSSPTVALDINGSLQVTGDSNFLGDLMITGKSFASIHVDHTPGWGGSSQEALEQLLLVETGEDGEIDHSSLPEFTRVKLPYTKPGKESKVDQRGGPMKATTMITIAVTDSTGAVEVDEATIGRDLGATITMLTEAVKALNEKNQKLSAKLDELCAKDNSHSWCAEEKNKSVQDLPVEEPLVEKSPVEELPVEEDPPVKEESVPEEPLVEDLPVEEPPVEECAVTCSIDGECDDADGNTLDVCNNDGSCDSSCTNLPVVFNARAIWGNLLGLLS